MNVQEPFTSLKIQLSLIHLRRWGSFVGEAFDSCETRRGAGRSGSCSQAKPLHTANELTYTSN